jgi:tetratricopeptide (TPR) repeat protein
MNVDGDKTFYTATMARVYTDQGRYDEAARIYRYLLEQSPDRSDLQQALQAVLSLMPDVPVQWEGVSALLERWILLILRRNALRRCQQIKISPACGSPRGGFKQDGQWDRRPG